MYILCNIHRHTKQLFVEMTDNTMFLTYFIMQIVLFINIAQSIFMSIKYKIFTLY